MLACVMGSNGSSNVFWKTRFQNMGGLIRARGAVVIDIRPDLISTGGFSATTTG